MRNLTSIRNFKRIVLISASLALFLLIQVAPAYATVGASPAATAAAAANTAANTTPTTSVTPPTSNAPTSPTNADPHQGFNGFLDFILQMFAYLVWVAGTALNVAAYWTIVKMGYLVGQMPALNIAWVVFRDLGNIVLIFGFIAMGIATILDIQSYGASKMLVTLLIVAVTINFSLFASRAIVDVGNIFGLQFYKAMNNGQIPTGTLSDNGISDNLMSAVKLTSLYHTSTSTEFANQWLVAILGIILFIVVTFIFLSIALMLVSRFIILVFLMTISPLAFAAMVIPKFSSQAKKWWEALLNNTIFAPIILLLLLVSLKVITGGNALGTDLSGGNTQFGDIANGAASPPAAWPGLIILFAISCGFFVASLLIAKQFSAFGAGVATKAAGRATFGTLAFAGRQTVGRSSNWASKKLRTSSFGSTLVGSRLANITGAAGRSSFDARGLAKGGKVAGIDVGTAQKGGFEKIRKDAVEAKTKYAGTLVAKRKTDAQVKEEADALKEAQSSLVIANASIAQLDVANENVNKQEVAVKDLQKQSDDYKAKNGGATDPKVEAQLTAAKEELEKRKTVQVAAKAKRDVDVAKKKKDEDNEKNIREGNNKDIALELKTRKEKYAKSLEGWGKVGLGTFVNASYTEAADAVRRDGGKSGIDLTLEHLKHNLEHANDHGGDGHKDEKADDGHGAAAAHTPTEAPRKSAPDRSAGFRSAPGGGGGHGPAAGGAAH